jgi:hypothetical protein
MSEQGAASREGLGRGSSFRNPASDTDAITSKERTGAIGLPHLWGARGGVRCTIMGCGMYVSTVDRWTLLRREEGGERGRRARDQEEKSGGKMGQQIAQVSGKSRII